MVNAYLDAGIQSRMNRIISPIDNRVVMLAIDHPYFQGPTTGLRDMSTTVKTLLPYCDCLMTTRGAVRSNIAPEDLGSKPIMLRVSGGNSVLFDDLSDEQVTVSIKEAIRMDAAGVAVSVFIGSANQQRTILNLTDMINSAEEYGIPVLAVTAVGKDMARDLRYLALASRICQDAGARIIKTYYCDEFPKLVEWVAPTAVVVAGGKYSSPPDALEMAYNSVQAGAAGVDFGRNIFQDDNPVGMIRAIGAIVHEDHTVREALEVYSSCLPGARKLD
ncbi:MAG TPA: 3-hydroxy-5-phosphonooxypentane-2,4-dione thiolase [Methanoregulaceae archaeon]|nr:MAG: 3-hydroxy-5-phosphonooxypentane-2,4-dione thiolase [Methanolinea sp.]HON81855.1 3-hydroxy-5-phosphonooxypentane-2,4-dione thiolase [Methanoregulaceae archaeon]HPD10640.1 3-hydroxy-5-phosphonooxypentane-2,4-dione thiolase [Methanoregulaceae archaeon]HRT15771.1 3-hydroxy-5-phosphonooxypentane-2,4-dione thiolase [Methanoregulaceae archaeon]HRU31285.1 3-hydroxy-5-phosphonooxypentane-2,4-dione thiolase [Methanoregulaceae archaeon]